jgi:hypothetical protein
MPAIVKVYHDDKLIEQHSYDYLIDAQEFFDSFSAEDLLNEGVRAELCDSRNQFIQASPTVLNGKSLCT